MPSLGFLYIWILLLKINSSYTAGKSLVAQLVGTSLFLMKTSKVQIPPPPTIELSQKKLKSYYVRVFIC